MGKQKSSKSHAKPCLVNQHDGGVKKPGTRPASRGKENPKSAKAKFVKKEKKLVKGKVSDRGNSDYLHSQSPSSQISKMLTQVDSGVCAPMNDLVEFQPRAFSIFLQAWIEQLARYTPLFVGITPTDAISPLEAWLYAFTVMYSVIRSHGRLSSPDAQYMNLDETFEVEASLAKVIQYYMPFVDGEINFKVTASPDLDVSISTGVLDSTISNFPAFGELLPYADGSFEKYTRLAPLTLGAVPQGCLVAFPGANIGSYLTWVQNRFPTVSNIIAKTNSVRVVRLSQIKASAPDASAYSARTTASGTQYVINYSNLRHREVSFVFSYASFDTSPNAAFLDSPIIANQFNLSNTFSTSEQYLARCIMWLAYKQHTWSDGPFEEMTLFGQKITSFNFRAQPVTGSSLCSNWQRLYTSLRAANISFDDNVTTYGGALSGLMLWNWALNTMYHQRCDISSPIALTKVTQNNASQKAMQQYYNPGLPGLMVPPPVARLVRAIGPIVQNGQVVYPMLQVRAYLTSDTNRGTLMRMSTDVWNPASNLYATFPFSAAENIASPNIRLDNIVFNSPWQANYDVVATASGFGSVFPNLLATELTAGILFTLRTVGGIAQNMVASPAGEFALGKCCAMGVIGLGALVALQSSPQSSTITIGFLAVDRVRSTCNLTAEEALDAACCVAYVTDGSINQKGPYNLALPRFANAQAVLNDAYSLFFSPNAVDPGTDDPSAGCVRVDGMAISRIPARDRETSEKSFDQYFSNAANDMLGGLRNVVCTGVAMGTGQIPVLGTIVSPVSKSLCDAGLPKLFNFIAHRAPVFSAESSVPKPIETCFNSRGLRIAAFQQALPCMLKAVGMQRAVSTIAPTAWKVMESWKKASLAVPSR